MRRYTNLTYNRDTRDSRDNRDNRDGRDGRDTRGSRDNRDNRKDSRSQDNRFRSNLNSESESTNSRYKFINTVLSWNLDQLGKPLPSVVQMNPLEATFSSFEGYYANFSELVLEETRAIIYNGLCEVEQNNTHVKPLIVTAHRIDFASNPYHPSTLNFSCNANAVTQFKIGDIVLLLGNDMKLTGSVCHTYFDNDKKDQIVAVKVIFPADNKSLKLQQFTEWNIAVLCAIVPQQRIYEFLQEGNYLNFSSEILKGRVTSNQFFTARSAEENLRISHLNSTQQQAVTDFLKLDSGMMLLQGPPGTGKTTTIVNILQALLGENKKVVVCAPSNKALRLLAQNIMINCPNEPIVLASADTKQNLEASGLIKISLVHWCERKLHAVTSMKDKLLDLEEAEQFSDKLTVLTKINDEFAGLITEIERYQLRDVIDIELHEMSFKNNLNKLVDKFSDTSADLSDREQKFAVMSLRASLAALESLLTANHPTDHEEIHIGLLNNSKIIFSTLNISARKQLQAIKDVDVVIVDEAGQALEVECLATLAMNPKTVLLAGDPQQLPPTVISECAKKLGLGRSLMERLINDCHQEPLLLTTQYRMHPEIRQWPSMQYYNNSLVDAPELCQIASNWYYNDILQPYSFFDIASAEEVAVKSFRNQQEANYIVNLVAHLKNAHNINIDKNVAVITFYSGQVSFIKRQLTAAGFPQVSVGTVDGIQGDEADIVLISCVRSNGAGKVGFVDDFRRLNVAMTRARQAVIVLGNAESLSNAAELASLIKDAKERDCFYSEGQLLAQLPMTISPVNPEPEADLNNNSNQNDQPIRKVERTSQPQTLDSRGSKSSNHKTALCKFFKSGQPDSCNRKTECKFAHGEEELSRNMSNVGNTFPKVNQL